MPVRFPEEKRLEFLKYYGLGLNDYEIARAMGISNSTTYRWRREFDFPPQGSIPSLRNTGIEPTQEEKEILCGTLIGDGCLQYYPKYRWRAPIFKCDHGKDQKEYAEMMCSKLNNLRATIHEYIRVDKRTNKEYVIYTVKTPVNPCLFDFYNTLYNSGKKEITEEFLTNFTVKSLAFLYMDDGYADQRTAYICTDSFSDKSKEILVNYIYKTFKLKFNIVNHGKYYRMRLIRKDFPKFCSMVKPYMIPSLYYKLNTVS